MTKEEIVKEIHRLSMEFEKYKTALMDSKLEESTLQNKEVIKLFASLHQLLQSPHFFELLFSEGFQRTEETLWKDSVRGTFWGKVGLDKKPHPSLNPVEQSATLWNFNSPIMLLLRAYHLFGAKSSGLASHTNPCMEIVNIFFCKEKIWNFTTANLDKTVANYLVTHSPSGESFLGLHVFGVAPYFTNEDVTYEQLIKELKNNPSSKATVLCCIYNGSHTEPVFFIKNKEHVEALVSSSHYIHSATQKILNDNKIPHKVCSNIPLTHDGNCSVFSELNINAALYEAMHCNNSVYEALDRLRNNQYSLNDYLVDFSDITHASQPQVPDSLTFARLLASISRLSVEVGSQGWVEFCKAKGIHPKHALKNPHLLEWDAFLNSTKGYSNWHDASTIHKNLNLASVTDSSPSMSVKSTTNHSGTDKEANEDKGLSIAEVIAPKASETKDSKSPEVKETIEQAVSITISSCEKPVQAKSKNNCNLILKITIACATISLAGTLVAVLAATSIITFGGTALLAVAATTAGVAGIAAFFAYNNKPTTATSQGTEVDKTQDKEISTTPGK